ncbi:allophanate hydrolase [Lentzea sp. NBRC 105346]|nr:allophanate hydrolase [Lentzea sp. NBRC 105346]
MLATGPQALVQDLGRPGHAHLGVPPSGALDAPSLTLANRLVGNPEDAAGLELLLGGFTARAHGSCTIAVTGPSAEIRKNGRLVDSHAPIHLAEDDVVQVGTPRTGLRCYLAASGGIDVDKQLGSRSTDVLSGIGPAPLKVDDVLPLGTPGVPTGEDVVPPVNAPQELAIPIVLGPRDDWFEQPAEQLRRGRWTMSDRSNRVGARLDGTALQRKQNGELPSEGLVTGAVQIPPNGLPVIFLNDHPTTGGYPVIGVVPAGYLPHIGQARPGVKVRFQPVE